MIMSTVSPNVPADAAPVDDERAVAAVVGGQLEFFSIIVRRYNTQLYRVGMAYLGHHEQVEDAMQNTYLNAYRNLRRFRGAAALGTWLTRIMINECLMTLRRRRHFTLEAIEDCEIPDEASPRAGDGLKSAELRGLLEVAISRLPRAQRAVYLMREVQSLSVRQTAECLRLTPTHVKVTLHRARERLKRNLLRTAQGAELFDYPAQFCDPMTRGVMALVSARPVFSNFDS